MKTFKPYLKIVNYTVIGLVIVLSGLVGTIAKPQNAEALSGSQFNPGRIIDDNVFFNKNAMSPGQIQNFLNSKVPSCDTNGTQRHPSGGTRADRGRATGNPPPYTCLKDYRQNTSNIAAEKGLCNGYSGSRNESSATIIYKVSQSCGINPQVLLVMLQKEQSLVTDDWPWKIQYQKAMGAFCPDTAPCDSGYAGFFKQMYYGAHRLRYYTKNPKSFNYRSGRNNTIYYHPDLRRCGSSNVHIQNQATANLYIYTPYRPNKAALNNLYGTGDSCSSYGNRNFWRMFNDWFGSTTNSVLFKVGSSNTYYLEWGDFYYAIPNTDTLKAYNLHTIAPRLASNFPSGKTRGPNLQRSAKFGSEDNTSPNYTAQVDVVDGGKRHAVPNWTVLSSHGFNDYQKYDPTLAFLLKDGDPLRNVVRRSNGAIYLLSNNKKRGFPDGETYSGLSGQDFNTNVKPYSKQSLTNMSDTYLNSKADGAPMLLDGKIFAISNNPAIYLFDNGQKHIFSSASYAAWGNKYNYRFSQNSASQIPTGSAAPILSSDESDNKFAISRGSKHPISSAIISKWGLSTPKFTQLSNKSLSRLKNGQQLGQLVTDHRPGIFYVDQAVKHGIPSLSDFSRLDFKWSQVLEVSSDLLKQLPRGADLYAPGSLARTPNGAVFVIDRNYTAFGVPSGYMFSSFGLSWKRVINVTAVGLTGYDQPSLQQFVKDELTGKYFIVDKGVKHEISPTQMGSSQYKLAMNTAVALDSKTLGFVKNGKPITRFLRGTGTTVYYIQNGKRHPLSTESAFVARGGKWADVVDISSTYLSTIPRGPIL